MDIDTDVPVRDQSVPRMSVPTVDFSETGWPVEYRMGNSPLSDIEGVASPSGLTAEEKVKVEVEEVEGNVNQVQYQVVEVPPSEPAQPVIEGAPAEEGTQPETTVGEVEAVVEPKLEPVEPVLPPVIVPWTEDTHKELKITTERSLDPNHHE
jgi:hypothetical protein